MTTVMEVEVEGGEGPRDVAELEFKMRHTLGRMEQRKGERKENISKARTEQLEKGEERIENKVVEFYANFDPLVAGIGSLLQETRDKEKEAVPQHLDIIVQRINEAQKYITDSGIFLPSYDMRNAQRSLTALSNRFQETQTEVLPKKKFGFKNKKTKNTSEVDSARTTATSAAAAVASETTAAAVASDTPAAAVASDTPAAAVANETTAAAVASDTPAAASVVLGGGGVGVAGRRDAVIHLGWDEVLMADVSLSHLENVKLRIAGCPSTLHISNIRNCVIESAPVATSVFLEHCQDSTLILSCQQLRIHNASHTNFYIHVTSKAVIEDSTGVSFGPNTRDYSATTSSDPWVATGLDPSVNNWDKIGDFNWLAADKPSPNWSLIPESDRVADLASLVPSDNCAGASDYCAGASDYCAGV